jgi:hypothetical protein
MNKRWVLTAYVRAATRAASGWAAVQVESGKLVCEMPEPSVTHTIACAGGVRNGILMQSGCILAQYPQVAPVVRERCPGLARPGCELAKRHAACGPEHEVRSENIPGTSAIRHERAALELWQSGGPRMAVRRVLTRVVLCACSSFFLERFPRTNLHGSPRMPSEPELVVRLPATGALPEIALTPGCD